jgi:antitoxin ParD1/3/4
MSDIILEQDVEEFVRSQIQEGAYRDLSDVIHAGLRLLKDREERRQALREAIDEGIASADAGKVVPFDEGLVEQIKQRGRERQRQRESQP